MKVERFAPDYLYPTRTTEQIKIVSEQLRDIKIKLKQIKNSKDLESAAQLKEVQEIRTKYSEQESVLAHNEQILKRNLLESHDYIQEAKQALLKKAQEAYENKKMDLAGKYTLEASKYCFALPDFVSIRQKLSFIAADVSKVSAKFLQLNERLIKEKLKKEPDAELIGITTIRENSLTVLTKSKGE